MKFLFRFFLLSALSAGLFTPGHAQTGGTETVVVQKTPAKATGYVPTVQANGKIEWHPQAGGGGGGGGTWGSITGTLSAQTDLQNALDAKLATATAASTYQPLNAKLTGFAALANASGYLFNNGSGVFSYQTPPGAGDALTTNPLSQFASTSSAQLRSVLNDETGTGIAYFVGGALGTPASGSATNLTGLPISGINGLGTGVPAALAVAVGSAGAPVVNGGALGTPSSGVATNLTGTAAGLTAGNVTTNANLTGAVTSTGNATSLGSFSFSALNSATTGDDAAGLAAANQFTGINQFAGASVTNANAMGALVIDTTKSLNTKTVAADSTFTFSGAPATDNTWFGLRVTNSDTSAHVVTIPSSFNANTQSLSTTLVVLAGGTETITWNYDGSRYIAYGIPSSDYAADAGASDTYAITLNPVLTAYSPGARFWFRANTANTGAATLNINALGAKTIKKVQGGITTDLADNDIRSSQLVGVIYDGTNFQMTSQLGNAPAGSGDAVLASNQTWSGTNTFSAATPINLAATATSGLQIFNTADQTTNYERAVLRYTSNVLNIGTEYGGTGNPRGLVLGVGIAAGSPITAGRTFLISNSLPFFSSNSSTSGAGHAWGISATLLSSASNQGSFSITPTYNQTGTASGTDLLINRTQTAVGSGAQLFADFQVGGTSRWKVDNTGVVTNPGNVVNIAADALSDDTFTGATLFVGKNAGATIAQWDLVYLNSSGVWVLCDADAGTPLGITGMIGLATTAGTNGNPLTVLQKGFIRNDGWAWTAGSRLYASGTPGALTHTAPSTATNAIMVVGAAITDDEIWFDGTLIWAIKG